MRKSSVNLLTQSFCGCGQVFSTLLWCCIDRVNDGGSKECAVGERLCTSKISTLAPRHHSYSHKLKTILTDVLLCLG